MKEFFTRSRANQGVKIPLVHPDGTPSKHWIQVRNTDSDAFRGHVDTFNTDTLQNGADLSEEEIKKEREEMLLVILASLIADWSFEIEQTDENKIELLREAPQIANQIDKLSTDKKRFFGMPFDDSTSISGKKVS